MLLPLGFDLALLVGRALACSDLVESAPLRLHPHMGVPREHSARDVPGDAHNHLVACILAVQLGQIEPARRI